MTSPAGDQRILFTQNEVATALKNEGFKQVITGESKFSVIASLLHKAGLAAKIDCQNNQSIYVLLPTGDQIKKAAINQGLASNQEKKGLVAKIAIESILKHQKRALGAESRNVHLVPKDLKQDEKEEELQIQTVENRTKFLKEAVENLDTIFKNVFRTSEESIDDESTLDDIAKHLKKIDLQNPSTYVEQEAKQIVEFLKTVTADLKEYEKLKAKFSDKQNYANVIQNLDKKELTHLPEHILSLQSTDINYNKFVGVVNDINEQSHKNLKSLKQQLETLEQAGDKRAKTFLEAGMKTRSQGSS